MLWYRVNSLPQKMTPNLRTSSLYTLNTAWPNSILSFSPRGQRIQSTLMVFLSLSILTPPHGTERKKNPFLKRSSTDFFDYFAWYKKMVRIGIIGLALSPTFLYTLKGLF